MSTTLSAFFYLAPEGEIATRILSDPVNALFKHAHRDGREVFRIGDDHSPKTSGQLITFGSDRSCCDIILPEGFPPKQCHFFINPRTGELLLRDDTEDETTWLSHSNFPSFSLPSSMQPRQRVVPTAEHRVQVAMQRANFHLVWGNPKRAFQAAWTKSLIPQNIASRDQRILQSGRIVHSRMRELGQGATAKVYLTLDLNTGDHLAVKTFLREPGESEHQVNIVKHLARMEVRVMSKLSHVRI